MEWVQGELSGIQLGDERLNKRSVKLLERLASKPSASIPGACGGWSETLAASRFLGQESLEWHDLLKPHINCTLERSHQHKVVLCLQDTTELDFNGQSIEGLGPLSYEAQRGMYVHPTYAVTPDRLPLGLMDAWMWSRELKDADGIRSGFVKAYVGEKATNAWLKSRKRIQKLAGFMWQIGKLTFWIS